MTRRLAKLVLAAATVLSVLSCNDTKEHTAGAILPEDSVSMMTSYGVNTLISDSGVIKYRIVAERWEVNTIRQPSRWEFMKGIFFEQFDEKLKTQGWIQADTAWYFDQKRLWKLRGRVRIRNISGMHFESEELFWDGNTHEFYSYVFSRLTTPERTIQGTYFRSDERMEHYEVSNSKGSFVREDDDSRQASATEKPEPQDSTQEQQPVRRQREKHAKNR